MTKKDLIILNKQNEDGEELEEGTDSEIINPDGEELEEDGLPNEGLYEEGENPLSGDEDIE